MMLITLQFPKGYCFEGERDDLTHITHWVPVGYENVRLAPYNQYTFRCRKGSLFTFTGKINPLTNIYSKDNTAVKYLQGRQHCWQIFTEKTTRLSNIYRKDNTGIKYLQGRLTHWQFVKYLQGRQHCCQIFKTSRSWVPNAVATAAIAPAVSFLGARRNASGTFQPNEFVLLTHWMQACKKETGRKEKYLSSWQKEAIVVGNTYPE